jgi:hypothetical protein
MWQGVLLQLESSSNLLKMTVVLASLELIHLVGHNQDGPLVVIQPSLHLAVMLSWFVADIHD